MMTYDGGQQFFTSFGSLLTNSHLVKSSHGWARQYDTRNGAKRLPACPL